MKVVMAWALFASSLLTWTRSNAQSGAWSSWTISPCSATCGRGKVTMIRTCLGKKCKGKPKNNKNCNLGACIKAIRWSEWSEFQPCDKTCGGGSAVRTRECIGGDTCKGKPSQKQTCATNPCLDEAGYTLWTKFSPCSNTCGGGIQTRTRTCMVEKCSGHDEEIQNCRSRPCPGENCVDRRRKCRKSLCSRFQDVCKKTCGMCLDADSISWGEYGPCSVTCGVGVKSRFKGSIGQTITCQIVECGVDAPDYSEWSKYSECTVTCGGGTRKRTRFCQKDTCKEHEIEIENCFVRQCKEDKCTNKLPNTVCKSLSKSQCKSKNVLGNCRRACKNCPEIETWTSYGPCSVTCGAGVKTRMKGMEKQSITCLEQKCETDANYGWGSWTDSGICSTTCGGGTIINSRTCIQGATCEGPDSRTVACETQACPTVWAEWSEWSKCTANCGEGFQVRARVCTVENQCTDELGERSQSVVCNGQACPVWAEWSEWSKCTANCGGGFQVRARVCTVENQCTDELGERSQTVVCNTQACPAWGDWSDWSECTLTCGGGNRTRTRQCTKPGACHFLSEGNEEVIDCNTHACAAWGEWTFWSKCSHSCGTGRRSRKRGCTIEWQCDALEGGAEEFENCNEDHCPLVNPSAEWSLCSKSCGEGTRYRTSCTNGECVNEYEGCNDANCTSVACTVRDVFLANRYESNHECCNTVKIIPGENCGKTTTQRRVIGGVDALKDRWPWIVAVRMIGGFCAGSLISKNFVLSAAHCFAYDSGKPIDTSNVRIIAGILRLEEIRTATNYEIEKSFIHPDYSFPVADIAVVKLKEDVKFGTIQPICMPWGEKTPLDSTCFVTGWGVSTVPNTVTNHLQELGILNYDPRICINAYSNDSSLEHHTDFLKSNKGYLCAGSLTKNVDSCSGDSGGPLVCQRCKSCTWYIAGVVSFGPNPCAKTGVPGIYSSVYYYENWILKITGLPRHSISCLSD